MPGTAAGFRVVANDEAAPGGLAQRVRVRPGDQDACGTSSQMTWRIRSALPTVPSHNAGTLSVPSGTRRGGIAFTGIACSRRPSSAGTGSWRSAAWTAQSRTASHWQAELSPRRAGAVPRCTWPGNRTSTAPCDTICRAHDPTCESSGRVTGPGLTAGAHSERPRRALSGPVPKWVTSRLRPFARQPPRRRATARRKREAAVATGPEPCAVPELVRGPDVGFYDR